METDGLQVIWTGEFWRIVGLTKPVEGFYDDENETDCLTRSSIDAADAGSDLSQPHKGIWIMSDSLAKSALDVTSKTMFSRRRGLLSTDFPFTILFSNAGNPEREIVGAEREMEAAMLQRVRDALDAIGAEDVGYAEDGYSWAIVAKIKEPEDVEQLKSALWSRV